jgi:hypothetical protein
MALEGMSLPELRNELRMYAGRAEGIHVSPSAFVVMAEAIDANLGRLERLARLWELPTRATRDTVNCADALREVIADA